MDDTLGEQTRQILAGLDPQQLRAVQAARGPVCILAGAGTGKTRTITHRIAYGVHTGAVPASQLLAVTFTTRAAGEMRGRLRALGAGSVQARTFHSAALRQLRYFAPRVLGGPLPEIIEQKWRIVGGAASPLIPRCAATSPPRSSGRRRRWWPRTPTPRWPARRTASRRWTPR